MNNNRNNNNNNFPSPQGDYLVLYIENVINTAILLRNSSQRVNPSRDWSPRLIPSCKLYRGPVPTTGPCDQSLRLVPSCVATLKRVRVTLKMSDTSFIICCLFCTLLGGPLRVHVSVPPCLRTFSALVCCFTTYRSLPLRPSSKKVKMLNAMNFKLIRHYRDMYEIPPKKLSQNASKYNTQNNLCCNTINICQV